MSDRRLLLGPSFSPVECPWRARCPILVARAVTLGVVVALAFGEMQQVCASGAQQETFKKTSEQNTIKMQLVFIPAGEFMMGNSRTPADEQAIYKKYGVSMPESAFKLEFPRHRVRLKRPFWMGAHHVTKGQFERFVRDANYLTDAEKDEKPGAIGVDVKNGTFHAFQSKRSWRNVGFPQTDDHPVVNVSWNDAVAFCDWLTRKEGKKYRLPTDAEWEYSCRAGTTTRFWCGDDPEKVSEVGNVADASFNTKFPGEESTRARDGYVFTSPVGKFRANPFGLFDMHGNVWQWCADRLRRYNDSAVDDPIGTEGEGGSRILRGGSWNFVVLDSRSAQRIWSSPSTRSDYYGFRVVREVKLDK